MYSKKNLLSFITIFYCLTINTSFAQAVAVSQYEFPVPQTQQSLDSFDAGLICFQGKERFEVINSEECLAPIIFGHHICYEGLALEVVAQINNGFYQWGSVAFLEQAHAIDNKAITYSVITRKNDREYQIYPCHYQYQ